jgi:hypothetical protein
MVKNNFFILLAIGILLANGCAVANVVTQWPKRYNENQQARINKMLEDIRKTCLEKTREEVEAFSKKLDKIELRMSTDEIKNILGKPDSVEHISRQKYNLCWYYKYPCIGERAKFLIRLEKGAIVSYTVMLTDARGKHYYIDHAKILSQ